jgi:hypothetical protein
MRRIRSGCCARATSGHPAAAPAMSVMNSRRPMLALLRLRRHINHLALLGALVSMARTAPIAASSSSSVMFLRLWECSTLISFGTNIAQTLR